MHSISLLLVAVAVIVQAARAADEQKTVVGGMVINQSQIDKARPPPKARVGEPPYIYNVRDIPARRPVEDPANELVKAFPDNYSHLLDGARLFESDIFCNCTLMGCDEELVTLLGEDYRGQCRSRAGVCRQVKYVDGYDLYRTYSCVSLEDMVPSDLAFNCLPRENIAVACCASGSFCNTKLDPRKADGSDLIAPSVVEHVVVPVVCVLAVLLFVVAIVGLGCLIRTKYPNFFTDMLRKKNRSSPGKTSKHSHISMTNIVAKERSPEQREGLLDKPDSRQSGAKSQLDDLIRDLEEGGTSGPGPSNNSPSAFHHQLYAGESSGKGDPLLAHRTVARQVVLQKIIGQGRFGEVWVGNWKGNRVAVKIFPSREERSWNREVEMYTSTNIRHFNVLRYIAHDNKDTGTALQLWLVTEFHEHGSLYDFLTTEIVTPEAALRMMRGIASGVAYLHEEVIGLGTKPAIAHRDLKTKNVLVRSDLSCVIADLGLAVRYEDSIIDLPDHRRCGTVRYLPPEILEDSMVCERFESYRMADCYPLGLIAWEIAMRTSVNGAECEEKTQPFHEFVDREPSIPEMRHVVCTRNERPEIKPEWNENTVLAEFARVMKELWSSSPSSRLTAMNVRVKLDKVAHAMNIPLPDF